MKKLVALLLVLSVAVASFTFAQEKKLKVVKKAKTTDCCAAGTKDKKECTGKDAKECSKMNKTEKKEVKETKETK